MLPRLARLVGLSLAPTAMALALVAAVQQQTMLSLGLIMVAITAGFLASWSARTVREMLGPVGRVGPVGVAGPVGRLGVVGGVGRVGVAGGVGRTPMPRHRVGTVALSRAQSRSFDYLAMRP